MMTRAARKRAQLEEWKARRKQKQSDDARERHMRYQKRNNRQRVQKEQSDNTAQVGAENVNSKLSIQPKSQIETSARRKIFGLNRSSLNGGATRTNIDVKKKSKSPLLLSKMKEATNSLSGNFRNSFGHRRSSKTSLRIGTKAMRVPRTSTDRKEEVKTKRWSMAPLARRRDSNSSEGSRRESRESITSNSDPDSRRSSSSSAGFRPGGARRVLARESGGKSSFAFRRAGRNSGPGSARRISAGFSPRPFAGRHSLTKSPADVTESEVPARDWLQSDFKTGGALGRGRFGNVYLAKHKASGCKVAIKVMIKARVEQEHCTQLLRREVEIQTRLKHPNIIQMYGFLQDEVRVLLLLEYAAGGSCYSMLLKCRKFSEAQAVHYMKQVCMAVAHCHERGVIHRDIKPENLLVSSNGIKLADFGWAIHDPRKAARRKTFCGTPDYMAPEMVQHKPYGRGVDVWALGILAFEFLCGAPPFAGETDEGTFQRILERQPKFTTPVSSLAKSFITALLNRDAGARVEFPAVQELPWLKKQFASHS